MKRMWKAAAAAVLAVCSVLVTGCEPIDEGGAGGVEGPFTFQSGYVFLRGQDLYLTNSLDTNVVQRLTNSGGVRHPALSRDGRRVVFARFTGAAAELVTVSTAQDAVPSALLSASATGGTNLRNPVFNPTGTSVVFVYDVGSGASTRTLLGQVDVDGTDFVQLTNPSSTSLNFGAPSFLPNGSAVLAPAGTSRQELDQLYLVTLSSRQATFAGDLSSGSEGPLTLANRVAVSPDGTRIAYDASSTSGVGRIYVAAFSQVAQPSQRLTTVADGVESFPNWESAVSVAFSSSSGSADNVYNARVTTLPANSTPLQVPSAQQPWFGSLE